VHIAEFALVAWDSFIFGFTRGFDQLDTLPSLSPKIPLGDLLCFLNTLVITPDSEVAIDKATVSGIARKCTSTHKQGGKAKHPGSVLRELSEMERIKVRSAPQAWDFPFAAEEPRKANEPMGSSHRR
jgi:hypothetical protein